MSFGKGNQPPVGREDLLSDPFSLPQMRELIGYILVLSWDCHFLSLWPGHLMVDSYRNQGAEEQTWILETRRLGHAWGLGLGLKGLWDWGRLLCSALLHSACQPMREVWKSHQQTWGQGPAWTRVVTNTNSPNKWLYMMWSLSDALRGRANAT